jgi:Fe2+ transport system protein FeoA
LELVKASHLKLGETATIELIEPNENMGKLFELGFIKGVSIKKAHISFDGLNICFAINNTMFAVRNKDSQYIMVTRETE